MPQDSLYYCFHIQNKEYDKVKHDVFGELQIPNSEIYEYSKWEYLDYGRKKMTY